MRKQKAKNLRLGVLKKATAKAVRAHKRRSKQRQAMRDEAPPAAGAGHEIPLAPAAEDESVFGEGVEDESPSGTQGEAPVAPEAAPWPQAGVRVAVGLENLTHSLRLGETGVSQGPAPDDPAEVIVKLDSAAVLAAMRIPRSLLVPVGAPMSNMRLWDKCSEGVKRDLLFKLGVMDPRDEVLPTTMSLSLTMWGEYLPIGLRLSEDRNFKFVQPAFVNAFEEGDETVSKVMANEYNESSFQNLEDAVFRQEVRQKLLKEWWGQHELLVVCLCDEASGSSGLLALRKTPMSVRFYEVRGGKIHRRALSRMFQGARPSIIPFKI